MMTSRTFRASALAGLVVVAAVALGARWARPGSKESCALDGLKVEPAYRVEVIDERGESHAFCCPACARLWLEGRRAPPRAVRVTDEATGEQIDAASACYVRSTVVTAPGTENRVHVFRDRADAERHAGAFGGLVLPGAAAPFGVR